MRLIKSVTTTEEHQIVQLQRERVYRSTQGRTRSRVRNYC